MNSFLFHDRVDAGKKLAEPLSKYKDESPLVLALPRGGVAIGIEIARALAAPLDVLVVRKIGAPQQPELAVGAIAEGGIIILDQALMAMMDLDLADLEDVINKESTELERRVAVYRGNRRQPQTKR